MSAERLARIKVAEVRIATLFETLADLLDVPNTGNWYQITAYVRASPEGTTEVKHFAAIPVRSGRILRVISEDEKIVSNDTPAF